MATRYKKTKTVIGFEGDDDAWLKFDAGKDVIYAEAFSETNLTPANARELAAWLVAAADRMEKKAKP